jgi:hypothetical protein
MAVSLMAMAKVLRQAARVFGEGVMQRAAEYDELVRQQRTHR